MTTEIQHVKKKVDIIRYSKLEMLIKSGLATRPGFSIDNWIYWTIITRNYR
jgi:hypothetical protein